MNKPSIRVVVSGSRSITKLSPIIIHYLDKFMADGVYILIGDAPGVDKLVQSYLASKSYPRVAIFYSKYGLRNNVGNWKAYKISGNYTDRDIVMHNEATCGLVVWDGKSKGSLRNINQLKADNKKVVVIK